MAATSKGVVGKNNGLPWHYPSELVHFKKTTRGQVLIMGRKTFETTPQSHLQKCTCLVFSKNKKLRLQNAKLVSSVQTCLLFLKSLKTQQKIYMIGGAELANFFLKHELLSEFILTKIKKNFSGEVHLNLKFFKTWHQKTLKNNRYFQINHLVKPTQSIPSP